MERCAVEARRGLRVGREPYSCFSCEGQECVLTTSALRVNWPRRDGAAGKAHPPHRVVTGVAVQARLPRDAEDVAVASHSPLVETEARGGDAACLATAISGHRRGGRTPRRRRRTCLR